MLIKRTPFKQKDCQVGRGGVDRASSSDARGPGFKPWPLHFKRYHFFTRNQLALHTCSMEPILY